MNGFEIENALKYGNKENDVIAQIAKIDKNKAIEACAFSIWKYAKRYTSKSQEKAFNQKDIDKILDYANRALELADKANVYMQIEEIINNITAFNQEKKQGKLNTQYYFNQIIDSCIVIYCLN